MGRPRKDDDVLVAALAHGKTHAEAGRLAGVSERTLRRRLEDPDFEARVKSARGELMAAASARLSALSEKAIEALGDVVEHGEDPVRVRAAHILLKSALEYHERCDLEARVAALESGGATRNQPVVIGVPRS